MRWRKSGYKRGTNEVCQWYVFLFFFGKCAKVLFRFAFAIKMQTRFQFKSSLAVLWFILLFRGRRNFYDFLEEWREWDIRGTLKWNQIKSKFWENWQSFPGNRLMPEISLTLCADGLGNRSNDLQKHFCPELSVRATQTLIIYSLLVINNS